MSITLIVRMNAKPGEGDTLRHLLSPLPPDNDIDGCEGWEIFSNASNPDDVMIVERWASVAKHKTFIEPLLASGALNDLFSHVQTTVRTYYAQVEG